MHRLVSLLVMILCLACCASLQAASLISAPVNFVLQRDQPGQKVRITVQGDVRVAGLTFSAQIADGGPGPITQGLVDGPDITDIDILNGALFGSSNVGADDPGSFPQFATRTTTTSANTTILLPAQPTVLATLTLDTTGVAPGTYPLILGNSPVALGQTELYDASGNTIASVLANGSLVVVPEPSGIVLAGFAAIAAGVAGLRRARRS